MSISSLQNAGTKIASLLFLAFLVFFSSPTSALVVTGGGNITNLSIANAPVTGGALNITGGGYYYFTKASGQATPAGGFINYTNESVDTSISIETANVTIDCMYPSLTGSIIAGPRGNPANNPALVSAGIVVNATRATGTAISNITIRNCIFTNFSRTNAAGILVIGNVSGLTVYNSTFNSSRNGIVFATNGTSDAGLGRFVNVNLSTNTFYNLTNDGSNSNPSDAILFRPVLTSVGTNAISLVDSNIQTNNFTFVSVGSALYASNVTNLTIFNNTVVGSNNGFALFGANNSNISNNNLTNFYCFGNSLCAGVSLLNSTYGPSSGDLSAVPNAVANNWIFNTSVGLVGFSGSAGIKTNMSNCNYTQNTVNYTQNAFDIRIGPVATYFNRFERNTIGNATAVGFYFGNGCYGNTLVGNIIRDSAIAFQIQDGCNQTSLVNNTFVNDESGIVGHAVFNLTSQDDVLTNIHVENFYFGNEFNFTATNITANLSNISYAGGSNGVNFTIRMPISVSVRKASDGNPLSSASVAITTTGTVPSGFSSTLNNSAVLDSSGTAHYNVTTFFANDPHGSLLTYNLTPITLSASLANYFDNSLSATLPYGISTAEQTYVISLTPFAHSSATSDTSTSSTPPLEPVVEPTNPPVNQPEDTATPTAPNGHSQSDNDKSQTNQSASSQSNVDAQAGQIALNLPVVGHVEVDPLVAVAVVVVIVLIVFILMGMM